MVPGLDSTKEELQATAEYFLARGLATLAIDGPGQGESEYELPIEPAYEKVATAAVDYLRTREGLDGDKTGLFGVSLGGYYAARAAAYETRLAGGRLAGPPVPLDLDWDELPAQTRATFQARSGAAARPRPGPRPPSSPSRTPPAASASRCSSSAAAETAIAPPYHQERLAKEAQGAELLLYPDGSHGVTNRAYESRSRMADWLAAPTSRRRSQAMPAHEVTNQAPPLIGYDASDDPALFEGLHREGAGWAEDEVRELGALAGSEQAQE